MLLQKIQTYFEIPYVELMGIQSQTRLGKSNIVSILSSIMLILFSKRNYRQVRFLYFKSTKNLQRV